MRIILILISVHLFNCQSSKTQNSLLNQDKLPKQEVNMRHDAELIVAKYFLSKQHYMYFFLIKINEKFFRGDFFDYEVATCVYQGKRSDDADIGKDYYLVLDYLEKKDDPFTASLSGNPSFQFCTLSFSSEVVLYKCDRFRPTPFDHVIDEAEGLYFENISNVTVIPNYDGNSTVIFDSLESFVKSPEMFHYALDWQEK